MERWAAAVTRRKKQKLGEDSLPKDPITERQMMSKGCIITSLPRHFGSITILSFGDWIPRVYTLVFQAILQSYRGQWGSVWVWTPRFSRLQKGTVNFWVQTPGFEQIFLTRSTSFQLPGIRYSTWNAKERPIFFRQQKYPYNPKNRLP